MEGGNGKFDGSGWCLDNGFCLWVACSSLFEILNSRSLVWWVIQIWLLIIILHDTCLPVTCILGHGSTICNSCFLPVNYGCQIKALAFYFMCVPAVTDQLRFLQWYRYNFHLFPRDDLNIGMPSYSFSCQVSHLTSMAREGFDFDACIYDGKPYCGLFTSVSHSLTSRLEICDRHHSYL